MSKHKSEISNRKSVLSEAELSQIEQATSEYDWETVRDLTAEALNAPNLAPAEEFDLRWHRAKAFDNLWDLESAAGEMQQMLDLARTAADDARAANALNMLAFNFILVGKIEEAGEAAHEARALARTAKNPQLEARALNVLAWYASLVNEPEVSENYRRQALALAENGVSPQDETWALRDLRHAPSVRNDPWQIDELLARALRVARLHGDRLGELYALNAIAQSKTDLARQIDNRGMISILNNNLATWYSQFGLFRPAYIYAQEAVQFQQKSGAQTFVLWSLDTLAHNAREAGEYTRAQQAYATLSERASQSDSRLHAALASAGQGRLALDEGQFDKAQVLLETAINSFEGASELEDKVNTLVWLSAAFLARDELDKALESSAQAMAITAEEDFKSPNYPLQDLWLMRYRVLTAAADDADNNEAWAALDKARLAMFEPIANIGNEGLRRNYLNKVRANRAISETWAQEATKRGLSLAPFTEREATPAAVAEQMQRIVESGARLAAERDSDKLAEFILQEFVELSGVERAVVALYGGEQRGTPRQWTAAAGSEEVYKPAFTAFAWQFIDRAATTRTPLLFDTAGDVPDQGVPELHLRSVIALPLISQGKLWGVLYGDMGDLFGRLNENDRDILSLLANQAGAALENANWVETLEQQVDDRTAEAEAARAKAERANEAKSAFMSNISHELRTPLNAIMGFTRIVKRKTEDQIPQKQTENLDKVLSSGEHLLRLINTILDIAKIESGRMDVINSRFHIGQLIEATTTVSQPLLQPGVDLNLNIVLGVPEINSDQDKVKQILLNLLSNAAKFTHEGSITVSARQESDTLIISVDDTGIGMNEEALSRVFEEFQQADATTRKKYGGTGLGMPISKHLAQLLGGDLTVMSTEGEGSTFTFTLPIEAVNS
jgi:signal transduction histidine kinase